MARTQTNGATKDATIAELTEQIDALRAELGDITGALAQSGKEKVAGLKNKASHIAEDAAAYAELHAEDLHLRSMQAAEAAAARAKDAQSQAVDFMKNQPATTLGLAAGAGFLIGYLMSRR